MIMYVWVDISSHNAFVGFRDFEETGLSFVIVKLYISKMINVYITDMFQLWPMPSEPV